MSSKNNIFKPNRRSAAASSNLTPDRSRRRFCTIISTMLAIYFVIPCFDSFSASVLLPFVIHNQISISRMFAPTQPLSIASIEILIGSNFYEATQAEVRRNLYATSSRSFFPPPTAQNHGP
ncbi:unnamed protein product [Linum trigynum]|uniref:Uncharacterized protein n=1 Tax=Linum trigynum TaxID=586398 RepID=A0AAV2EH38_9ROSI